MEKARHYISSFCIIDGGHITVNGKEVFGVPGLPFTDFARAAYHNANTAYPKFFKMDNLSKLAFLAAGHVLDNKAGGNENNTALLFANSSSSLDTDVKHLETIANRENYYPSPAVFVYTLPNICLGEISIAYRLHTENCFFIFAGFNPEFFAGYAGSLLKTGKAESVLCGWVEFFKDEYKAFVYLVSQRGDIEHTAENINILYNK